MKTITYIGPEPVYSGWDHNATPAVEYELTQNIPAIVSDEFAEQVLAKSPDDFTDGPAKRKAAPKEKVPPPEQNEAEAGLEQLLAKTRAELNELATELGIENPDDKKTYKTNQDIANAILEAAE